MKETDYGTFMSMIEKKNIGEVEVKDNQIIFTDKDQKNIYKTGLMNDPNLTDIEKNGTFDSPATAFASIVLPVPGGPTRRTPFGIDAPTSVYFFGL